MNCHTCQSELPGLLLDPTSGAALAAHVHLETCAACQKEFDSLQATFALLDTWHAPEPSPYFDQKLAVMLREEIANAPAGFFERLQSRLLFNTGRQFRPALVGALALVLLLGGGTFAGITSLVPSHDKVQVSATVDDLQILDKNDQAIQQMDQLLQEDTDDAPPLS